MQLSPCITSSARLYRQQMGFAVCFLTKAGVVVLSMITPEHFPKIGYYLFSYLLNFWIVLPREVFERWKFGVITIQPP